MTTKVTVIETPRYADKRTVIGVYEFARVPVKGDYLSLEMGRVLVDWVLMRPIERDGGEVIVAVNTQPR